jgi:hypothetical protein
MKESENYSYGDESMICLFYGDESTIFLFYGREYREVSFSVGGQTTWREVVTLPNILKIFNPNLYDFFILW